MDFVTSQFRYFCRVRVSYDS